MTVRILFELNHPAHFHLFKNAAQIFKEKGYKVTLVVRQKDVLLDLVQSLDKGYKIFIRSTDEKEQGFINNIIWLLKSDMMLLKYCLQVRPDIMCGSNFSFTHIGKFLRIPTLLWVEDDSRQVIKIAKISNPFASKILAPSSCSTDKWEYKTIHYNSYHELAYLNPKMFQPQPELISNFIDITKPFFVLRFSKLAAHHDKGKTGITTAIAEKLVEILNPHGKIYITSERELEPQFEPYRIMLKPCDIHHALYYANLYIGDSQTMAAEAAVLGTPSIRFNDFVGKLGYLEELEHKFGLTFGIRTLEPEKLLTKVKELLAQPDLKATWQEKRNKMLAQTIDVNEFMVWLIENYPSSYHTIKNDPKYQNRFAISRKNE